MRAYSKERRGEVLAAVMQVVALVRWHCSLAFRNRGSDASSKSVENREKSNRKPCVFAPSAGSRKPSGC